MNPKETLDRPHDRRLSGLDLVINRFHVINPDAGELLISELKHFSFVVLAWSLFFIGFGGFLFFIAYREHDPAALHNTILALVFGLILMTPGVFGIFTFLTNKAGCHFSADDVVIKNAFGRKKMARRQHVESVYITRHATVNQYKQESNVHYTVDLKVSLAANKEGSLHLLQVEEKDNAVSALGGVNPATLASARHDALQIAHLIAEHWNIPVSI